MKKPNYAQKLAGQIETYLKDHPHSTQTEMQIALGFEFNHWRKAIALLKDKVKKDARGNSAVPAKYSLINP